MRHRIADLDGPVHYIDFGGAGPAMLMVHGLGGNALNWMAVGPELAQRYHAIAIDLAGFGQTPLYDRSATVGANADLVQRFIAKVIGEPVVLMGNSMGGHIAILVGADHADSVTDFKPGTLIDGPTGDWLEAVAASAQTLAAVGDNGAVYTSTDGVSWKRQASLSQWLRGVAFGNGTFIAVGENGLVATSPNGTNWNNRASGTAANLNRVAFTGDFFTAVGEGGVALTSTNNGVSWLPEDTGATNDLFHAASGDSRYQNR